MGQDIFGALKEKLAGLGIDIEAKTETPAGSLVKRSINRIQSLLAQYRENKPGSLEAWLIFVNDLAPQVVDLAEEIGAFLNSPEFVGADKRTLALDVARSVYFEVNPDLPWVPEPVETWLEERFFANVLPLFIQKAVDRMNAARAQ